jgi:class 3 adenylate cyclase
MTSENDQLIDATDEMLSEEDKQLTLQNKAVLVVDDNMANLQLLTTLLKRQGYILYQAQSGAEALEKVRSKPPDLILLDIRMPEMDGFEVCRRLKANNDTRDIPVIFISALQAIDDKIKGFTVGGVDYITKPFQIQEVLARVKTHLDICTLQQRLQQQNLQLQKEIQARRAAEEELRLLNAELENRVLERTRELCMEQERSEKLLLSILPKSIAERLKRAEVNIADTFKDVSVLFADIVGFTELSASLASDEIVTILDRIFTSFDMLAEKHKLEKIKTIGDAYMVVGGLPDPLENHTSAIAEMALDMLETVNRLAGEMHLPIQVRIGINTGPVTAGIIGRKKFIYDLWGDMVNTASRMESTGLPGTIQVTEATYKRLHNEYRFKARGEIPIKGKGLMRTYFLQGRKKKVQVTQ